MALAGSGGGYYRSNATIPSSVGLHNAFTRHFFARSPNAPSTANWKMAAEIVGSGQNPHDQFRWNAAVAGFQQSNGHRRASGAYAEAQYATSLPANTWLGLGATFDGTNTRSYLDGVLDATSAATAAASANAVFVDLLAAITFAGSLDSSSNWTDGTVAEYAYWNVPLTAAEMAALGKGFKPFRVRPQSLVFYAPCVRSLVDVRGGRTLVLQAGSNVVAAHPAVR